MRIGIYMKSTNITVRMDENLYNQIKKEGINISEVVRTALEAEVAKRKKARLKQAVSELSVGLKGIDMSQIVADIRKTREER